MWISHIMSVMLHAFEILDIHLIIITSEIHIL